MSEITDNGSYTVADYLLDRLHEAGVDRIFGVPGDYTLAMLDHVVAHPGVVWSGSANELNAGYAADGYARMRGIGAVMTTFGVGELSAINALAGSYAEHVPVIEIVGSPASGAQAAQRIVHPSLGDGQFTHFLQMHSKITCARAAITPANAAGEIDRVIGAVRDQRLPGYLLIPADVAIAPAEPPRAPLAPPVSSTDPAALAGFTAAAASLFENVDPAAITLLGGLLVHRFGATAVLQNLLAAGPLSYATTVWAKSLLDESSAQFLGVYSGSASTEPVRRGVEDAAVIITAGVQFTDLNSGFFSQQLERDRTVEINAAASSVGPDTFAPLRLPDALQALIPLVAELTASAERATGPAGPVVPTESTAAVTPTDPTEPLSQSAIWDSVAAALRPGDIVVADQGTSFYGMATHRLPDGVTFLGQPLWASIGYSLPAVYGACLAEPGRRGVLLIGDGAAQLTVQEIGSMLRDRVNPVIVVVDNDGYTVERAIHGPTEPYNDIARWDWTRAGEFFGPGMRALSYRADTVGQLDDALADAARQPDRMTVIQAVVPPLDVPALLTAIAQAAARANARS